MPKPYDDALKKLFRANAQDFVTLVQDRLRIVEFLPAELDAEHIFADGLARCVDETEQEQLAHFEYQREYDPRMGERLLEYNVLASRLNGYLPVISCVICLKKHANMPRPPFIRRLPNGTVITHFNYICIDLGEISVADLLAKGLPGLLPLIPLTDGGNTRESIDIMTEELIRVGNPDLLWIGLTLAAKVLTTDDDLEWLRRRKAMLSDFLADSPLYQETMAEGEAKGEARGIETGKLQAFSSMRQKNSRNLMQLIQTRFPDLEALAHTCVSEITSPDTLSDLLLKVAIAQTEQEARRALEASLKAS
jgi:predicted transposase YdaD